MEENGLVFENSKEIQRPKSHLITTRSYQKRYGKNEDSTWSVRSRRGWLKINRGGNERDIEENKK